MKYNQGKMETNSNGVNRESNEGRGRFDLFPYEAMEALAKWYEEGAKKYGERNWEKGIDIDDCLNRMVRHALKAANNFEDEDHLSAVMWNAAAVITMRKRMKEVYTLERLVKRDVVGDNPKNSDSLNRTIFKELENIVISKNSKGKPCRAAVIKNSKLLTYRMTPSGGIFDIRKHNNVINPNKILKSCTGNHILCVCKNKVYKLSENRLYWIDISYRITAQLPFMDFETLNYGWDEKDQSFYFIVSVLDSNGKERFEYGTYHVVLPVIN